MTNKEFMNSLNPCFSGTYSQSDGETIKDFEGKES